MNTIIAIILLLAFNGLAFWQRHLFIYLLVCPINIVYGLNLAAGTTLYSNTWVMGVILAILGVFLLFKAGASLLERN